MFERIIKALGSFLAEMKAGVEDAPIEAAIYVGFLLTIATVLVYNECFYV